MDCKTIEFTWILYLRVIILIKLFYYLLHKKLLLVMYSFYYVLFIIHLEL